MPSLFRRGFLIRHLIACTVSSGAAVDDQVQLKLARLVAVASLASGEFARSLEQISGMSSRKERFSFLMAALKKAAMEHPTVKAAIQAGGVQVLQEAVGGISGEEANSRPLVR